MTAPSEARTPALVELFERGLDAPICLTWELTYACNLACVHCLSSSGKRDARELSTRQCKDIIDELERMQVFYVNIGGGEPTVRPDFWELVDYATEHHVGVKFSTNGVRITPEVAARLAASDYVDIQISLDGATPEINDAVRGPGSFAMAIRALENLAEAGFRDAKVSVVVTRHNVGQLDDFAALADRYGATLRITRLRPSGRGADVWDELHPTSAQQVQLYDWLVAKGEGVLTGDSFFHLSPLGGSGALAGLNMCGAGRVVCLIDPVGDVYACPFAIHDGFRQRLEQRATVSRTARTAVGGRLRQLRALRQLSGRLHGGQVLHRPADRRSRSRMRPGLRRIGAGGRPGEAAAPGGPLPESGSAADVVRRATAHTAGAPM
jgi:mycofactocin biosynthetic radical S-adenosylmethionine protein MftC